MTKKLVKTPVIDSFNFPRGKIIAGKYQIISKIGEGWEGEVYIMRERATGIERAVKFLFPHRNKGGRTSTTYAKKLHKLRDCPILITYHSHEEILFRGAQVVFLVSEYVEGELLSDFLSRQPGKRISVFQGVHLLHALVVGIEGIHRHREYHGDLHPENIILRRFGLGFDLKVVDLFNWGGATRQNIQDDICDLIRIFYDAVGGKRVYPKHPPEVKAICCGLKRSLILKKFKTATRLREYLENMQWS